MATNRPPRGGTRHTFGPPRWHRRPPREAPATFGDALRQARRARGLSLEDAERETHIPFKYLAALEDQEYGALPTPVYARGVLRAYARFLELDPEPLLAEFRPPRPRDERA
jgi:cytoskeletal protein RodZ